MFTYCHTYATDFYKVSLTYVFLVFVILLVSRAFCFDLASLKYKTGEYINISILQMKGGVSGELHASDPMTFGITEVVGYNYYLSVLPVLIWLLSEGEYFSHHICKAPNITGFGKLVTLEDLQCEKIMLKGK